VEDVKLTVTGTPANPHIYFSAVPDDLYYKPPGLGKPLRAAAGLIVYDHDDLTLKDVSILSRDKTIITSLTIEKVSKECTLKRAKAKSDNIDLSEINYYLSSTAMPPPLRKAYLAFLKQYQIANLHGKAYGDILCQINGNDIKFDGIIGCYKASAKVAGYPVTNIEGIFAASGEELMLQDVVCFIRGSKFTLNGYVNNYRSQYPTWQTEVSSTLAAQELVELIPDLAEQTKTKIEITSKGPLSLRAKVSGNLDFNQIQYSLIANKKDALSISGAFGKVYQPPDTPITLDGVLSIKKNTMDLSDTHLLVGDTLIRLDGQIAQKPDPGRLFLTFRIADNAAVDKLMALVYPPFAENVQGKIGGSFEIKGDMDSPVIASDITLSNIAMPQFAISNLNGSIKGGAAIEKSGSKRSVKAQPSLIQIDSVNVKRLAVKNIKANLSLAPSSAQPGQSAIVIDQGEGNLAGGTIKFSAKIYPDTNSIASNVTLRSIAANEIGDKLLGHPREITGKADADLELSTIGGDSRKLVHNLNGHGTITVKEGVIARVAQLQTGLTRYNLLTQGIFGFNVNNLVQSLWPVRTGQFHTLNYAFDVDSGAVKFNEIRFSGDDLRLWGNGTANLETSKVNLEIAGKIPRVASSRLGAIGMAMRNVTIQKLFKTATFGRLQNLPSLPVLGDIASDKPRSFIFQLDSQADDAKAITRSIEKSFKWIPEKRDASAHPVPGIQHQM